MHIIFQKKTIALSIDYLWPLHFVLQDSRQNDVVSPGPNRAVSVFETIEAF